MTKSDLGTTYSLVIPNQLSALREMSAWLDATIRHLEMPEELIFNFDLCANEAVTNIISYAYPRNGAHEIALHLSMQNQILSLEIEDDGIPYNPLDRPKQTQPENLDAAEVGGLGVDLIRSFMNECNYSRQQGRNILKMVTHIAR